MSFKLQPVDFCVHVDEINNPYHAVKRWALGSPYSHVSVYFGGPHQLFYESVGRGVVFTLPQYHIGKKLVVMRFLPRDYVADIQEQMLAIAADPQSYYDYLCIPTLVLPRLVCDKLGIPLPLKYQRNPVYICSEAGAEPCWRIELEVVPQGRVPLPGDFIESALLDRVHEGVCDESWFEEPALV